YRPNSNNGVPWSNDEPPSNMTDKYVSRPTPGTMANRLGTNEDLHNGKTNITIPFFDIEYFDYKIPVSINNRYPQHLKSPYGEPTLYLHSNVGGDWTLSVDEYKVTRQINGNIDELPTIGYFSSFSQSKI